MSFASLNYLNCATVPSGTNIDKLYYLQSASIFLSGLDSTYSNIYFILFNFGSVSIEWSNKYACFCSSSTTNSLINYDKTIIYTMILLSTSRLFISQNSSNGIILNSFNPSYFANNNYFSMKEVSKNVYISFQSSSKQYLVIYDPNSDSFRYYSFTNNAINIDYITYSSTSQRVILGGVHSSNSYLLKASINFELSKHPDISLTSSVSFSTTTLITVTPQSLSAMTIESLPQTSASTEYSTTLDLINLEYNSDRYIILDTQDLGTIPSCTQKSVTLDLT